MIHMPVSLEVYSLLLVMTVILDPDLAPEPKLSL